MLDDSLVLERQLQLALDQADGGSLLRLVLLQLPDVDVSLLLRTTA